MLMFRDRVFKVPIVDIHHLFANFIRDDRARNYQAKKVIATGDGCNIIRTIRKKAFQITVTAGANDQKVGISVVLHDREKRVRPEKPHNKKPRSVG